MDDKNTPAAGDPAKAKEAAEARAAAVSQAAEIKAAAKAQPEDEVAALRARVQGLEEIAVSLVVQLKAHTGLDFKHPALPPAKSGK